MYEETYEVEVNVPAEMELTDEEKQELKKQFETHAKRILTDKGGGGDVRIQIIPP